MSPWCGRFSRRQDLLPAYHCEAFAFDGISEKSCRTKMCGSPFLSNKIKNILLIEICNISSEIFH